MSQQTTKTGALTGKPQTQSVRPWRTLGRSNAKVKCYSAQPAKLGQDITARAYIVELERYCNWLEKQNAQLKDGFEKKLQKLSFTCPQAVLIETHTHTHTPNLNSASAAAIV